MVLDVRMGDVMEMRKAHPCGGVTWEVVRVGADIELRGGICDRRILMDRLTLYRRAKGMLERGAQIDPAIEEALFGSGLETSEDGDEWS
jgi:hypothetical protein